MEFSHHLTFIFSRYNFFCLCILYCIQFFQFLHLSQYIPTFFIRLYFYWWNTRWFILGWFAVYFVNRKKVRKITASVKNGKENAHKSFYVQVFMCCTYDEGINILMLDKRVVYKWWRCNYEIAVKCTGIFTQILLVDAVNRMKTKYRILAEYQCWRGKVFFHENLISL